MILRSQLRMNKNIMFPFISCILIMLTLLVLIHKSADELNTVRKELGVCEQKHKLTSTQLQNAIDYKLRLEKLLETEKSKDKQHSDELQNKLNQEQEERQKEKEDLRKEKEDADTRYDTLQHELDSSKTENQDLKHEISKLSAQLVQSQSEKDKEIENLKDKIKILENMQVPSRRTVVENKPSQVAERVDLVQSGSKGSTTPGINPQAIVGHDESPKQVAPPPNNGQDMMRKSLDMRSGDDAKMDENVIKAPMIRMDDKKNVENVGEAQLIGEEKRALENDFNMFKNQQKMNLPLPYLNEIGKKVASSVSNNAAERVHEDQGDNLPAPVLNPPADEKEKLPAEIPKQIHNNYLNEDIEDDPDYDKNDGPVKDVAKKDV